MTDVVGRDPTIYEALLTEDAKRLAPSASMERLDAHAKYLFSTVAVLGTLIAGFGFVKADRATLWIALPVTLIAISLACAIIAITPAHSTVNPALLTKLHNHYAILLRSRGFLVRVAGILFGLALLTTPFVFWAGSRRLPAVAGGTVLKLVRSAIGDSVVEHVELSNVPDGCSVRRSCVATSAAGTETIETYVQDIAGETVKFDAEHPVGNVREIVATTEVHQGGRIIFHDVARIAVAVCETMAQQRNTPRGNAR